MTNANFSRKNSKYLFQLREYFDSVVQINLNSIILIVSSVLIFSLFTLGYGYTKISLLYQLGGLISLDLIISVFFIHPIHSLKRQGSIQEQVTDWRHNASTASLIWSGSDGHASMILPIRATSCSSLSWECSHSAAKQWGQKQNPLQ